MSFGELTRVWTVVTFDEFRTGGLPGGGGFEPRVVKTRVYGPLNERSRSCVSRPNFHRLAMWVVKRRKLSERPFREFVACRRLVGTEEPGGND